MRLTTLIITGWLLALPLPAPATGAATEHLELIQRRDVLVHHQRFVGNIRAQAKRDGIVVDVPQIYVYHSDHSEAWHLSGFRSGFVRELGLTVDRLRRERNMVRLDRLLERTVTPAGGEFTLADLPESDVYILLYRRSDCTECEQVEAGVKQWLEDSPGRSATWIDVWIDRRAD